MEYTVTLWVDGGCIGNHLPPEREAERRMYGSFMAKSAQGKEHWVHVNEIAGSPKTSQNAEMSIVGLAMFSVHGWIGSFGIGAKTIREHVAVLLINDSSYVYGCLVGDHKPNPRHLTAWYEIKKMLALFSQVDYKLIEGDEMKAILGH